MKIIITESQCKLLIKETLLGHGGISRQDDPNNITEYIKWLTQKYIKDYDNQPLYGGGFQKCSSAYDINNGLCVEFSEELATKFPNGFVLEDAMFFQDDYKETLEIWGVGNVIKTYNGGGWNKEMLKLYGLPPVKDIKAIDNIPAHAWFYYEGKHYDAEAPEGVNTPWELPIMVKFFKTL